MMKKSFLAGLLAVALGATTLTACKSDTILACTRELSWTSNPQSTTLRAGESFIVYGEMTSCGGRERIRTDVRWVSSDTAVLRLEYLGFSGGGPYSGTRVTALKSGSAYASGRNEEGHADLPFRVDVTVLP